MLLSRMTEHEWFKGTLSEMASLFCWTHPLNSHISFVRIVNFCVSSGCTAEGMCVADEGGAEIGWELAW